MNGFVKLNSDVKTTEGTRYKGERGYVEAEKGNKVFVSFGYDSHSAVPFDYSWIDKSCLTQTPR